MIHKALGEVFEIFRFKLQSPTNKAEIDRCSCVFRIAWANNFAEESTLIFGEGRRNGRLSVTITSVK